MNKSGPKIFWKRACYLKLIKISWLLKKKINVLYKNLGIFSKKRLCPAIFDSFERNFTCTLKKSRTYTRFHELIDVFLYARGSRGVGRICDDYANPRRCFWFKKVSRILPAPWALRWRNKRKSLLLHNFWSMLIHAYRIQLVCAYQLTNFDKGQPRMTFHQMKLRKQTIKQIKKSKTNMTTRGTWLELSRNHNSVTEEALRFSFSLYDRVYNVFFRLLSPESPLFIFNHVAQ